VILKAFSASDPNLEHEYRMLRRLHSHPNMFVQLHTAVTVGSARLGLEMEYISDAVVPFCPLSEAELQCYMRSLLKVHPVLTLVARLTTTRR
jgi:predicted house-cleaning NTP pyrophosphatase (Maf/HAM1 superfamily)